MHLVLQQVWDVMAFHLLPWYFVGYEPERASQVVLIKPTDCCLALLGRLNGPLQWGSHLLQDGYMVWLTGAPCTLAQIRYGIKPAFDTFGGLHDMSSDQIKPYITLLF